MYNNKNKTACHTSVTTFFSQFLNIFNFHIHVLSILKISISHIHFSILSDDVNNDTNLVLLNSMLSDFLYCVFSCHVKDSLINITMSEFLLNDVINNIVLNI